MAGTVIADKVQAQSTSTLEIMNGVANTPPTIQDSAGTQVGTFCRAWVNFNGTGTVAINASFNVSSITDNGTGDYTVNFTTALPDANYGSVFGGRATVGSIFQNLTTDTGVSPTTSALRMWSVNGSGVKVDSGVNINVAVFR